MNGRRRNTHTSKAVSCCIMLALLLVTALPAKALFEPKSEAWERWRPAADVATITLDHSAWANVLSRYLNTSTDSGIYLFDYAAVTSADRQQLQSYVDYLASQPVLRLTAQQQQAYWINLYNALTVALIVDNPGVASIRDIKDGFFSLGPWNRELVTVDGVALTLNDIEHRILRPLYRDARVHFAVNCASLGCPDLQAVPFTADNLDALMDSAARAFLAHPRGLTIEDEAITVSTIFKWFDEDFGDSKAAVLSWIADYAPEGSAEEVRGWAGKVRYEYDWDLNKP